MSRILLEHMHSVVNRCSSKLNCLKTTNLEGHWNFCSSIAHCDALDEVIGCNQLCVSHGIEEEVSSILYLEDVSGEYFHITGVKELNI